MSVVQSCSKTWNEGLSIALKSQLLQLKIIHQLLEKLWIRLPQQHTEATKNIALNTSHVVNDKYDLVSSNRRYRVPIIRKVDLQKSFVRQLILKKKNDFE